MTEFNPVINVVTTHFPCNGCNERHDEIKALRAIIKAKNKQIENLHTVIDAYDRENEKIEAIS